MEAGFEPMKNYIRKRQNMVAQYIATRSILNLCEAEERNQGACVGMRWQEQAVINTEGAMETATAAAEEDKDGIEE